jgi:hypothetical protein
MVKSYTTTLKGVKYEITKAPASSSKKLKATYMNKTTGRENTILFGAKNYEHYYDKSGLLPKSLNHLDKDRRRNYRSRHRNDNLDRPSAGLLSWTILW